MATVNKAAKEKAEETRAKAKAAVAESNGKVEPIDFRGLELTLTPKLPLSVVARFGVLRDDDVVGAFRILEAVIGRSQYQALMDKLDEEEIDVENEKGMTEVGELLNKALARYGLAPGEAEASDNS